MGNRSQQIQENKLLMSVNLCSARRGDNEMHDLLTWIRLHREVGYGFFAAFFAALMAWHREERLREIFWKAIVTAGLCMWIEDWLAYLSFPTKWAWGGCIVVAYIGVDVILDKVTSMLGFSKMIKSTRNPSPPKPPDPPVPPVAPTGE